MKRPRTDSAVERWTLVVGAGFAIAVAAFLGAPPSNAGTGNAGPVTVTVTPTDGIADGQTVAIHAEAPADVELFEIRAHLCQHGATINDTYAFGFQDGFCPNVPVGSGDVDQHVQLPRGTSSADLDTFKVGAGSVTWTDELGGAHSLTCGPGAPCDVVVQVQITNNTVFYTAPMCYGDCAARVETPAPSQAATAANQPPPNAASRQTNEAASSSPAAAGSGPPSATVHANEAVSTATTGSNPRAGDAAVRDQAVVPAVAVGGGSSPRSGVLRVLAAEAAGVVGGVLIVLIVVRARRRMATTEVGA